MFDDRRSASNNRAVTVFISLLSAALGALGGHVLDYITSRELKVQENRAVAAERIWAETGDMYRQLFAMRPRLIGSILAYRQDYLERQYVGIRSASTRQPSTPPLSEYTKAVDSTAQQVVNDRAQLELLLGWADLAAPAGDKRWSDAIQSLVSLDRWSPSRVPANLASLDDWKRKELERAHDTCTRELNPKFATLLKLVKEKRSTLDHAADP